MKKKKALILLSGGMDSVTAVYYALNMLYDVTGISFSYGSKHNEKERAAGAWICKNLDIPFYTYNLPMECWIVGKQESFLKSNLLQDQGEIPEGHYAEESMKSTVVPFRNGIMLALAAGFAESREFDVIILANHAGDHNLYPDCREVFTIAMGNAIQNGTYNGVQILSPFGNWNKAKIAIWGMEHDVPYEHTWTCYNGQGDRPCLKCGTCQERTGAFLSTGYPDPFLTKEEWKQAVIIYTKTISSHGVPVTFKEKE